MKILPVLLWALLSAAQARAEAAKNVILFIGDGLGPSIVTAVRLHSVGPQGALAIDQLPYTAILKTYAADDWVTDSAQAATALACGRKTNKGILGEDASAVKGKSHGRPLECLVDIAQKAGKAAGLVSTDRVTRATPAAFYARHHDREDETDIAAQFLAREPKLEVLFGGGRREFLPAPKGLRKDRRDLIRESRELGYEYVSSADQLRRLRAKPGLRALGLFADSYLSDEKERLGRAHAEEPELRDMTAAAIRILRQNPKGYFLMVEGGKIDYLAHGRDFQGLMEEVLAFDRAVKQALSMTSPEDTLILVTADHDTGGLAIMSGKGPGLDWALAEPEPGREPESPHTGADVHLSAIGPGADGVHGTMPSTEVFALVRRAWGL